MPKQAAHASHGLNFINHSLHKYLTCLWVNPWMNTFPYRQPKVQQYYARKECLVQGTSIKVSSFKRPQGKYTVRYSYCRTVMLVNANLKGKSEKIDVNSQYSRELNCSV